jgi:Reverse transcriptase (RNA-dependent DNA polymerase)
MDLYKAFDCLNSDYLNIMLRELGFPNQLLKVIMACVRSSKFRIKPNKSNGGGFISPSRGLIQGCLLSPYIFILAMEPLTRKLNDARVRGVIRGLVLALGAPPLTHCLYADDVVLFGEAGAREAYALAEIMNLFGQLSGLRVNNDKSIT